MTPARILVVDNDPWIQRMVATILGRRGHLVTLSGDAKGALACAIKVPPEVVVTSVTLPAIDGWSWVERLRTMPDMSFTPVIFLSALSGDPAEIRGFELGLDECLPKPFRVEDLEQMVATVLSRARDGSSSKGAAARKRVRSSIPEKPSASHRPLSVVRGLLDEISLPSLLTVLEMERKTGILLLEKKDLSARLFLSKGRIIRAEVDGPQRCSAAVAVYHVLTWTDGQFDFLVGDVGGIDEIQTSTTYLLMEGARRIDELNHSKADG